MNKFLFTGTHILKFETNYFGVIEVTQALMDLLQQSPEPRIVNVTSGLGSLTLQDDPSWKYYQVKPAAYVSSKAALNGYTLVLAYNMRDTPFRVNTVDPDYTATDFNNHRGTVPDAAARVVKAEHATWLFRLNYDRLRGVAMEVLAERIQAKFRKKSTTLGDD